jgi:hypothetical protein
MLAAREKCKEHYNEFFPVSGVREALRYESEGCVFDFRWVFKRLLIDLILPASLWPWVYHILNHSRFGLGLYSVKEMKIKMFWGRIYPLL